MYKFVRMEQRDYILREIEKISVLIRALLGRMRDIVDPREFRAEREKVDRELEESAGISLDSLIAGSEKDIKELLSARQDFNFDNIEQLALLLVEFARVEGAAERARLLKKALYLLEWIDMEGRTFSMERQGIMSGISMMLEEGRKRRDA